MDEDDDECECEDKQPMGWPEAVTTIFCYLVVGALIVLLCTDTVHIGGH